MSEDSLPIRHNENDLDDSKSTGSSSRSQDVPENRDGKIATVAIMVLAASKIVTRARHFARYWRPYSGVSPEYRRWIRLFLYGVSENQQFETTEMIRFCHRIGLRFVRTPG